MSRSVAHMLACPLRYPTAGELRQASTEALVEAAHLIALPSGVDPVGRRIRLTRIQHELHRREGEL